MFESLKIEISGKIAHLILNRPQALNALNKQVLKELVEACEYLNKQKEVRAVIIKGEGKCFSAGADLNESMDTKPEQSDWLERREQGQLGYRMCEAVQNLKAVSIAQVHGFAIGGAFLLMLACDFRLVEESTFFSIPEVDLGIPLTWGGIPKLISEIGPLKTKELVMTCRRFDAKEAMKLGLLNHIFPKEMLEEESLNLAQSLSEKPALALLMTKEQIHAHASQMTQSYLGSAEGDMLMSVLKDPESKAAALSFLSRLKEKDK
ncbi:MAG: enoyl-CoA hydratase/isomerase family protein [Bacteroidia bacterium]|nr:enoyl-CoA hydratase/isomerase family protein [Bacteroidia bacterium]